MRCLECNREYGHEKWCSQSLDIEPLDKFKPVDLYDVQKNDLSLPPLKPIRDLPDMNLKPPEPPIIPNTQTGVIRSPGGSDTGLRIWDENIVKDVHGTELGRIVGDKILGGENVQIGTISPTGEVKITTHPSSPFGAQTLGGKIRQY